MLVGCRSPAPLLRQRAAHAAFTVAAATVSAVRTPDGQLARACALAVLSSCHGGREAALRTAKGAVQAADLRRKQREYGAGGARVVVDQPDCGGGDAPDGWRPRLNSR
jgi:hypothetical protein